MLPDAVESTRLHCESLDPSLTAEGVPPPGCRPGLWPLGGQSQRRTSTAGSCFGALGISTRIHYYESAVASGVP